MITCCCCVLFLFCLSLFVEKTYIRLIKNLPQTNIGSLVTCLLSMLIIYCVQKWINPTAFRKFKMPVPIELIVVSLCLLFFLLSKLIWKRMSFTNRIATILKFILKIYGMRDNVRNICKYPKLGWILLWKRIRQCGFHAGYQKECCS